MPYQGTKLSAMILAAWHQSKQPVPAFGAWTFPFEQFVATLDADDEGRVRVVRVEVGE